MSDKLNLIETLAKDPKFSTFSRILDTSGVKTVIGEKGEFTVFAPTNDAFGKIPEATMKELVNEPEQKKLKTMLAYHILPGKWMTSNLESNMTRKSSTGEELGFSNSDGLKVNDATIQARNIEALNGVIHQIDSVLAPPVAAAAASGTANASSTTPAKPII